jgi:putative transposase
MPRTARGIAAGYCYHVINRANNKARIFHDYSDYAAFIGLIAAAQLRNPVALLAACLMPNHVHLVLQPAADRDIGRWMHWLFTSHVSRHHRKYQTGGRLWQGRFRASAVQRDSHLLIVMRYVERNALRAQLVSRAEDWPWGSLQWRMRGHPLVTPHTSPVPLPADWAQIVNAPQTPEELESLRASINRQRPIGSENWVACATQALGMQSSVGTSGRPRIRVG